MQAGKVKLYTRYEMEDVVIVDGRARGIIAKNLVTGKLERFSANAVVIATGGYGNTYFLSTNAMGCNCTAAVAGCLQLTKLSGEGRQGEALYPLRDGRCGDR